MLRPDRNHPQREQHERCRRKRSQLHEPPPSPVPNEKRKVRGQTGRITEFRQGQLHRFVAVHAASQQIIETIFQINGLGYLAWESIQRKDLPTIQAIVLVLSVIYVALTLAADLLNAFLDPRLRVA